MPQMDDRLRIELLGGMRMHDAGDEISVPGGKAQQLLAYLLIYPKSAHARETLAELLWPEMEPARSRRNLSDILYRLRQAIPVDWLYIDSSVIGLHKPGESRTTIESDLWEFQNAVACDEIDPLRQALALYRGPLLPDLYEDWLGPHRRALQEQFLSALTRVAQHQEQHEQLDDALQSWLRAIQTEPLLESAYRGVMRVLARLGRLPEALNLYEQLVDLLDREVAAPPSLETRELADALFRELELARQPAAEQSIWRPGFVGRTQERRALLAAIEGAIRNKGCVLAVDGPGGIGKTRLLEEVADSARWRGATVIWGRAGQRPVMSPLAPLAEAVGTALEAPAQPRSKPCCRLKRSRPWANSMHRGKKHTSPCVYPPNRPVNAFCTAWSNSLPPWPNFRRWCSFSTIYSGPTPLSGICSTGW